MMTQEMGKKVWVQIEVTKAYWDSVGEWAETFVERMYEAKGPRGTEVCILRFGPFSLPRDYDNERNDKLKELNALIDMLRGPHIVEAKITSKPF